MTLKEIDEYFNSFLKKENFSGDPSRNGIQIQNSAPATKQITKVAFAVDACVETAKLAAESGTQLLFVHHGLFWGGCDTLVGNVYERIASFIKNDLALCAYHIPLDANNEVGNNYGLAKKLSLKNCEPFADWRGMTIGVKGELENYMSVNELEKAVCAAIGNVTMRAVLPFGKSQIKTVGIVSGGAGEDVEQAVASGLDAYITGEVDHELFHYIKENKINVIAGGHYATETVGVQLVMEKLQKEKGVECIFIDVPTGL